MFTYVWLEMYARGVRPVFYITRPVLHLLARLSQSMNIERSLTDTFALMYTLSFPQLARVSAQLLSFTVLSTFNGTLKVSSTNYSFYYDASLPYFLRKALTYVILAVMLLGVFVLAPNVFSCAVPIQLISKIIICATS